MSKITSVSKNYIFNECEDGSLEFIGNFEEFYRDEEDPWSQSGEGDSAEYYHQSRTRVIKHLQSANAKRVLEIGCGLGHALKQFSDSYPAEYTGWDISETAVSKGKAIYPDLHFETIDITQTLTAKDHQSQSYDFLILNQLLWYILPQLEQVLDNCNTLLVEGGFLLVSNAFARNQRFGNGFIDGYDGAFKYFQTAHSNLTLKASQFSDGGHRNNDGLFLLQKITDEDRIRQKR